MRGRTLLLALIVALAVLSFAQTQGTKITFFVEHQVELQKDYLEMVLEIKSQDTSLKEALAAAEDTVTYVRNEAEQYCKSNSKKKGECQQITESGKFNVEPIYRLIRQEPVFITFSVTYEVTAKILQTNNVGQLVDKINRREGTLISSLQWKALQEGDEQIAAIGEGVQQAEKRCKNLGLVVGQIEQIEQSANFQLQQVQEEGQEQQQGDDEQDEPEVVVYKFVVSCIGKQNKKK